MRKWLVVTWGVLGCLTCVPAADSPVDAGLFSENDYWLLALSEKQLEEVESRRCVTLSKDQWRKLHTRAPSVPKKIGVASPFVERIPGSRFSIWPGQVTGIWYCRNKVAIALDSLGEAGGHREFNAALYASDAVLIDTHGGYSIGPRKVSFEKLLKSLDALTLREPDGASFEIFILRPPVLSEREAEAVVQDAIDQLVKACQQRGLGCRIGG